MKLSRRAFFQVGAATAACISLRAGSALAEARDSEGVAVARAVNVILNARETHVVLMPVPLRRRPKTKSKPKAAKPRMQLVLRDVVIVSGGPAYDVYLVLEGPNIFEPTTTRVKIGALTEGKASGEGAKQEDAESTARDNSKNKESRTSTVKPETITFRADQALATFAKTRRFNMRHLRVVIARRALNNDQGSGIAPPDPTPPQIGAIELVRSY